MSWITPDADLYPVDCRHPRPGPAQLCPDCQARLVRMLFDLPQLDRQLADAAHDTDDQGELTHYARRAMWQRRKLAGTLGGRVAAQAREWLLHVDQLTRTPDFPRRAFRFSTAFIGSRRVVDRPESERPIGPCPVCAADLYAPDVDDHARASQLITCRSCGVAVNVQTQRRSWLDDADERWLTVTELVAVISEADEPITRNQVNWWAKTRRMERRVRHVPRGVDPVSGETLSVEVAVYQVGVVRALAHDAATRRT